MWTLYNMKDYRKACGRTEHKKWTRAMNKDIKIIVFLGSNFVMEFLFWVVDKYIQHIQY